MSNTVICLDLVEIDIHLARPRHEQLRMRPHQWNATAPAS